MSRHVSRERNAQISARGPSARVWDKWEFGAKIASDSFIERYVYKPCASNRVFICKLCRRSVASEELPPSSPGTLRARVEICCKLRLQNLAMGCDTSSAKSALGANFLAP